MNEIITTPEINTPNISMNMFDIMDKAYKYSDLIASSDIIPLSYRNRPANCFIAITTAYRMKLDPFVLMNGSYIVKDSGILSITGKFAIGLANTSGLLKNRIKFKIEGAGDNLRVTAFATYKNGEEISYTVGMKEAHGEGWVEKKGSKYNTLPDLMLRYRAASFLINTHMPEVLNGLHIIETEDIQIPKNVTPTIPDIPIDATPTESLSIMLDALLPDIEEVAIEEPVLEEEETQESELMESSTVERLYELIGIHNISNETITKWCESKRVQTLDQLTEEQKEKLISSIILKYSGDRQQS